jgi:hypothetical protein
MLQSDDVGGAPLLDFESWRALLRSNCGRDVEVTAPTTSPECRRRVRRPRSETVRPPHAYDCKPHASKDWEYR